MADTIRQKHGILLEFFEILGVGHDTANQDAEGIEHHLNPKTIKLISILKYFIVFESSLKYIKVFGSILKYLKIF